MPVISPTVNKPWKPVFRPEDIPSEALQAKWLCMWPDVSMEILESTRDTIWQWMLNCSTLGLSMGDVAPQMATLMV